MLFGLLPLAIFAFIIWWAFSIRSRVHKLDRRLSHIEQYLQKETETLEAKAPATEPKSEEVQKMSEAIAQETYPERTPSVDAKPGSLENFGAWIKEDWLMKLGGFLLILALAWFVSYAFEQGWVGPVGKIGIGIMAGIAVLGLGRYRITAFPSQGGILMFVGALGVILTLWAARYYYDFFTPGSALLLMFLVSAVLGVTSVQFNRYPLAYANVLLGAIAPLLIASGSNSFIGLYSYLFVLSLGSIWVAMITGWRQLILSSLIIVSLYGLPFLASSTPEVEAWGLITMYAFAAMFFFTSIIGTNKNRVSQVSDLFTAVISAILLFAWTLDQVNNESWASVLLMVWTVVYAFGSFTALRYRRP